MSEPVVGIIVASRTDLPVVEGGTKQLEELGVAYELDVLSPHFQAGEVADWASGARDRGLKVLIAASSGSAHLAGAVAAHTTLPVIGIPCRSTHLGGADALYATVQMPKGVPVATVGLDAAENAAVLAAQILATTDPDVEQALDRMRQDAVKEHREHREWTGEPGPRGFGFRV